MAQNTNQDGLTKATSAKESLHKMDPNALIVIGVDTPDGPEHPLYDERIHLPVDEDLVTNIMRRGVLVPVTVKADGDKLIVVDGRRRVLHARVAAKRQAEQGMIQVKVPVQQKRGDTKDLFAMSRVMNRYRVADSPIINAKYASKMLDMGASPEEIANDLEVKVETVNDWIKLLDTPEEIQAELHTGALPVNAGLSLAQLPADEALQTLAEVKSNLTNGQKVTAERVDAAVRARRGRPQALTPKARLDRAKELLGQLAKLCSPKGDMTREATDALPELLNKLSLAINSQKWTNFTRDTQDEAE